MKLGKHHSEADAAQCYVSIGAYKFQFYARIVECSPLDGVWWYYSRTGRCTRGAMFSAAFIAPDSILATV